MRLMLLSCCLAALLFAGVSAAQSSVADGKEPVKASAYYHFAMGHLYAELAASYGNKGEFLDKAIESYREALKADPSATFLAEQLSDLYVQAGRLREAVEDAEATLAKNPNDANARRILGRIYTRLVGDSRQGKINEQMIARAIEQYKKLGELVPKETDTWLTLGRLHKLAQNSVESEAAYKKVLELEPDHEEALIGLAMVYSDLGDQQRASEMLSRVVAKNPSVRTLTALGRSLEQQRDHARAAEIFRRALEMDEDNSSLKFALAENLLLADRVEEALKTFQEVAAEDPKDYRAQLRLSQIYRQQKKPAESRQALDKAKQAAPDNLEVLYHEVNLLESEGKEDQAITALSNILESTRKDGYSSAERSNRAVFLERLGLMYRGNERFEEAVAAFGELRGLDEEFEARATAQISDTYRQAKEFRKAADEIEPAYQKHPDNRMVGVVRATVLADVGKTDEAVATIKKVAGDRKNLEDLLTMAQIYEKTRRFDEMEGVLKDALELTKEEEARATVLFMRGAMWERRKEFDKAEATFREVLKLDPDNTSAMNYLGYMFADRNVRLEEAHQLVSKALELDPQNGAYLDSLGWVYYRMGKLDEAGDYLRRAAQKVSRDPVVHDHLGDVYLRQGRLKEAISHWRVSLKEWDSSPAGEKDSSQVAKIQKKLESAEVRLAKETSAAAAKQ